MAHRNVNQPKYKLRVKIFKTKKKTHSQQEEQKNWGEKIKSVKMVSIFKLDVNCFIVFWQTVRIFNVISNFLVLA